MSRTQRWLPMFTKFIGKLQIDSKETGVGPLRPYGAQKRFIEEVCAGLDDDVRFFVNLKARQLGITTISLAIDLFWLFVHPGMQGALITDTDDNKEVFRHTIERYLEGLPADYKVRADKHNRNMLSLNNGSVLQYMVAGARGNKTLGTSRGLNFLHATEVAKWGDNVGLDSLLASLAEHHPDRLYLFESTANGFNHFNEMWYRAKESTEQRAFFIGWWAKEIYSIPRSDRRYRDLMTDPPDEDEKTKATIVATAYDHVVTPEQVAWYRERQRTRNFSEGAMEQEFPWHEEEAFIQTGHHFFPANILSRDLKRVYGPNPIPFKGFRYILGESFTQTNLDVMQLDAVRFSGHAELRVYEEPHPTGKYVIGLDPAYGRTDWGDSHAISVWRCYADKLVQVAEYDTPNQETYQVIWVLAHLASVYRDCIINLEVNGPGTAILQGIKHLKAQMMADASTKGVPAQPKGFMDVLQGARWYLFHRPDTYGGGYMIGFSTTSTNKLVIMNQLRDTYMQNNLLVKSGPLLRQMERIVQDGIEIGASGKGKDDRVFAAAFAHKAWIEKVRQDMLVRGMTMMNVLNDEARLKAAGATQNDTFVAGIVRKQFEDAAASRRQIAMNARFQRRF